MPKKKKLSKKPTNDVFICRVCLVNSTKKLVSIFDKYRESTIYDYIVHLANVKISPSDGLPTSLCDSCLLELETAVNFKLKCEESDVFLHKTLSEISSNNLDACSFKEEKPTQKVKKELEEVEVSFDYLACDFDSESLVKNECDGANRLLVSNAVQCHDCGDFFKSKCKLRVHWKNTHIPKAYVCQICKKSFKNLVPYNRHVKKKDKTCMGAKGIRIEGVGKNRVFYCSSCDYSTNRLNQLHTHRVIHTGERPFQCNLCPNNYTQISSLLNHKENAHQEFRVEITCNFCGKYVRGRQKAYKHLLTHSEARYQCDHCKLFVKTKSSLILHLSRHTGVKSATCELCAASFYSLPELLNHKRNTHARGWYNCDKCGFRVRSMEVLRKHQMKHDAYEHFCTTCGLFFTSAIKLMLHEQRHVLRKTKKNTCPFCDKSYMRSDRVRKHIKMKHKQQYYELYPESDMAAPQLGAHKGIKVNPALGLQDTMIVDIYPSKGHTSQSNVHETPVEQVKPEKAFIVNIVM